MSSVLKLFRTTTFRLALIFMALFGTAAACAIGYIYWQTNVLLNSQLEQTIEVEIQGLAEQYRSGGISNLAKTVANRSLTAGNSIYLVTDSEGDRITGNLTSISRDLWNSVGRVEFVYNRHGQKGPESRLALVNVFRLKGGFRLIVGRDIEDRRVFERADEKPRAGGPGSLRESQRPQCGGGQPLPGGAELSHVPDDPLGRRKRSVEVRCGHCVRQRRTI